MNAYPEQGAVRCQNKLVSLNCVAAATKHHIHQTLMFHKGTKIFQQVFRMSFPADYAFFTFVRTVFVHLPAKEVKI